uniref:Desaturase 8 n=1 Tax=Streltzoviella insularis TaxID=1206366 RepID=A0A7D5YL10_9NEOP|nr:desaturase 8 [Streltzoviella insularis]
MAPSSECSTVTEEIVETIGNSSDVNLKSDTEKKKLKWYQFETRIVPVQFAILLVMHISLFYFLFAFPYRQHPVLVAWAFFMTYVTIMGVTAGIHRFWSHRTYKATLPVRIMLAMFFYASGQMKIRQWSRQHRIHHKYADTDGDPHNAKRGFFFSHIGWLMLEEKKEVDDCRKKISVDDVLADPVVQFFDNNYALMQTLCVAVIPTLIPWYFWGQSLTWAFISQVCIRYPIGIHITASVNSFAHAYGYRTYDRNILPTENYLISLLTIGEGWHNFHHAFPWDYRASEFSAFFFNPTTAFLNILAKLGLIYDLRFASEEHIKKFINEKGDGTAYNDKYRAIDKSW